MTRLAVYTKLVSPECSLTPRTETLESLPLIGAEGSILLRKIVKGMQISEMWDAVRVARIEAGLPVCGHKDCEIPFDAERITEEDVAEVIRRAEDEAFALLKANWSIVERVTNALCRRDRLTAIELDDLITSPNSAGKRRRRTPQN